MLVSDTNNVKFMSIWSFWLILAVGFMIAEVMVLFLTCLYVAFGALAAMGCALFGGGWQESIIVFVVSTTLLYIATFRFRAKLSSLLHKSGSNAATGMDALIGRVGRIDMSDPTRMRIDGDVWQVRASSPDVDLQPGDEVKVLTYDSIVLIVEKTSECS